MIMKSLMVCLMGLLIFVQAGVAQQAAVAGQVRLMGGLPVAGAQVLLFDLGDLRRGVLAQATTDADGVFALPLAALGGAFALPEGFVLGANYPNPFNPATLIPYQLAATAQVRLEVFNALGQRMATLVEGEQGAGTYRARWDGTDGSGRAAAAGVYLYRLTVDGVQQTGRMVLVDGQAGVPMGGGSVEVLPMAGAQDAAAGAYGLVVAGEGLVAYIDADFRVVQGMEPVAIEVAAQPDVRMKVVQSGILGDVDNNGQVDTADGLLVAMYLANSSISMPNNVDISRGDVNCDRRTDWMDAWLIVTYSIDPSDPVLPSGIGQVGGCTGRGITGAPKMYWTDWEVGKVQRANLDGSNVQDLLTGLGKPSGIALDIAGGKMYWGAQDPGKVQRANLDGSNVQDLLTGLDWPYGIALDIAGGKMYWTDWEAGKIRRANLDGSNVQDLVTGLENPDGIALDIAGGKMYWTDGVADKIQRANLNGSNVQDLLTGLATTWNIALDVAGGKMYWTDWEAGKVQRANLDGSNVQDLLTGLGNPDGIALDIAGGKMYWTDWEAGKIRRANLDGSNVQDLVTGLEVPGGIALDVSPP